MHSVFYINTHERLNAPGDIGRVHRCIFKQYDRNMLFSVISVSQFTNTNIKYPILIIVNNDDVIKWKPFSALGIHQSPVNSPHKGQWLGALMFSLICALNKRFSEDMMTSSNGNMFRVTGHLWGEFTGHRWIPRTKASKQSWSWWFETPSRPLWRHCNESSEKIAKLAFHIWSQLTNFLPLKIYNWLHILVQRWIGW